MEDDISFAWGDKGGVSSKKDVQFYKSFKYDDITYSLFDNVYLFKDGDPEPHIGKIVKIWAQVNNIPGTKKVKVVWFLHPSEIRKHLGSYQPSEKEVFLACGNNEDPGVADINPLEAIAGKCHVICTLKDERNLQPNQADIERADFVFSRIFDVKRLTLSDELPATIASLKIELLLNKKEDLTPEVVPPAINGAAKNLSSSSSPSPNFVPPEPIVLKISATEVNGPRQEENSSLKVRVPFKRKDDDRSNSVQTPVGIHSEEIADVGLLNEDKAIKRVKHSDEALGVSKENKVRKAWAEENVLHSMPSVEPPSPGRKGSANGVLEPEKKPVVGTRTLKNGNKIVEEMPKKIDSDGNLKKPVVSTGDLKLEKKAENQVEEVPTKPVEPYDRSKWFDYSGLTWLQKLKIDNQEGKVVLLQNFDASLSASEIQDLIFRATEYSCSVRLVTNYTYGDYSYGMAYAFFRNKEAAHQVVAKLNKTYLVLPDGRPLLCSKGALKIPEQSTSFMGHFAIEKLKKKLTSEESKKAVSTAHCSQSNTIEFEMAVEWIAAEEKFKKACRKLSELHRKERERVKTK